MGRGWNHHSEDNLRSPKNFKKPRKGANSPWGFWPAHQTTFYYDDFYKKIFVVFQTIVDHGDGVTLVVGSAHRRANMANGSASLRTCQISSVERIRPLPTVQQQQLHEQPLLQKPQQENTVVWNLSLCRKFATVNFVAKKKRSSINDSWS